jgi:hypothetical protein
MASNLTGDAGALKGATRTIACITSWEMTRIGRYLYAGKVRCVSKHGVGAGHSRRMILRGGGYRATMFDVRVIRPRASEGDEIVFTFQAQLRCVECEE